MDRSDINSTGLMGALERVTAREELARFNWLVLSDLEREHPFYVERKGFVPAGGLKVGDHIVMHTGPPLLISSLVWRRRPEGYPVHNIVVQGDHSYFVGTAGEVSMGS